MLTEICSFGTLSRLWDKRVRIESAIPPGRIWDPIRHVRQDAYTSLVIHKWMLKGCKIDASLVDGWCGRVNACLAETGRKYPAIFKPYSETALAANPIWNAPAKDLRARRK